MAYDIDVLTDDTIIPLGNQAETGVTAIEFDVAAWSALYPTGAGQVAATPGISDGLHITYTRYGESGVYPVDAADLALASDTLTWTVGAVITDIAGQGTIVVHCTETGIEKCSALAQTYVTAGHAPAGTPPEPLSDYIAKWGDVDIAVTRIDNSIDPTASVTQDGTGTHFVLGIPNNSLMRDIENTLQTATLNPDGTVASVVHTDLTTLALVRTDLFDYSAPPILTQTRTLADGSTLTITTNLITMDQTISNITGGP